MEPVKIIGAGLAGCEAAWQLAQRGIPVELHEMKPEKMTPAHHSPEFAELVCSNSLRSDQLENAVGLLKEELRRCGSLIMSCADAHRVEAGGGAQLCEWTSEGGLNGFGSVDADGDPPVIHRARVMAREASGRLRQFGWYRRSAALVPCGMRSCFFIGCAPKSRPPAPAPPSPTRTNFVFWRKTR